MVENYALILAGGSGERFWPLSRRTRPKQLLALFSDETLLESTIRRLDGLVPPENILILTNRDQEPGVRAIATSLPAANIVAEPAKRDTAPAVALGAAWVARRNPNAAMFVLPADHLIQDTAGFQRTLRTAAHAAGQSNKLVTIGIPPSFASPSFGYLELGGAAPSLQTGADAPAVHEVIRFCEKPDADLAATFLAAGNYRWNAGMFIWQVQTIVSAFARHAPECAAFIDAYQSVADPEALLTSDFPMLPKISIDYAIMEKAAGVLAVEAAFDWDDVGGWTAAARYLPQDDSSNAIRGEATLVRASNNIIFSDRPSRVALLGVRDLIVVETGDALLVCHRSEAEKIKELVAQLPSELQ